MSNQSAEKKDQNETHLNVSPRGAAAAGAAAVVAIVFSKAREIEEEEEEERGRVPAAPRLLFALPEGQRKVTVG